MAARVVSFCFLFRTVEDYMSDTVDFVITNENWDNNFDEVRVILGQQSTLLIMQNSIINNVNWSPPFNARLPQKKAI